MKQGDLFGASGWAANQLLAGMTETELDKLLPMLEWQQLPVRSRLESRGRAIERAHFLLGGVASQIGTTRFGTQADVAMLGSEGMTGVVLLLGGVRSSTDCVMQIAGESLSIDRRAFQGLLERRPALNAYLLRYVKALLAQMANNCIAQARAKIEERLARCILMCCDRMGSDRISLTHEALSEMVSTRRASVTNALHQLEGDGVIRATRASIQLLDRPSLIKYAGGFYGSAEGEHQRILEQMRFQIAEEKKVVSPCHAP